MKTQEQHNTGVLPGILFWLKEFKELDLYWKKSSDRIYENELKLTDPELIKINHIRQLLRFILIPALERAQKKPVAEQHNFLNFNLPFSSKEEFDQFLHHYYGIQRNHNGKWEFIDRDSYDLDVIILYDLLKVKLFITEIVSMIKYIKESRLPPSSGFSKPEQIKILEGIRGALLMAFKQSLKPEYHWKLYQSINPDLFTKEQIEFRREKKILYAKQTSLEGSPYRRIFLKIFFRQKMKAAIPGKYVSVNYDLTKFELLRHDYLKSLNGMSAQSKQCLPDHQEVFTSGAPLAKILNLEFSTKLGHASVRQQALISSYIKRSVKKSKQASSSSTGGHVKKSLGNPKLSRPRKDYRKFANKIKDSLSFPGKTSRNQSIIGKIDFKSSGMTQLLPSFGSLEALSKFDLPDTQIWAPQYHKPVLNKLFKAHILILAAPNEIVKIENIKEVLLNNFHDLNISLQITTPKDIFAIDVRRASLIITVRCDIPSTDARRELIFRDELNAEIVDLDLPLSEYQLPLKSSSHVANLWWKHFKTFERELQADDDQLELQKSQRADRKIWELKQKIQSNHEKILRIKKGAEKTIPQYHALTHWLIYEALKETTPLTNLIQSMIKVSRFLIIDSFEHQTLAYFSSIGFERSLLSSWDHGKIKSEVENYQSQQQSNQVVDYSMTGFLKQKSFNRYDVVLFVDWYNSTDSVLPVYLRIRRINLKGKKKDFTKIYSLNLFKVFDNQESFLDYCYSQLYKIHGINKHLQYYSRNFEMLRQKWLEAFRVQQENHAIELHILALQKQIDDYFVVNRSFSFDKQQKLNRLNRIAYFISGHHLRSWYLFGNGDQQVKAS